MLKNFYPNVTAEDLDSMRGQMEVVVRLRRKGLWQDATTLSRQRDILKQWKESLANGEGEWL